MDPTGPITDLHEIREALEGILSELKAFNITFAALAAAFIDKNKPVGFTVSPDPSKP
jgi:hypothetical protein